MLNKTFLQGRLTADPELKSTSTGVPVCQFRLAVERDFKDKDGKKQSDFITVIAWRQTAEFVSRFFSKGRIAIVEGSIQTRDYTDRDGNKRTATEVVANSVHFGDSRSSQQTPEQKDLYDKVQSFQEITEQDPRLPF